MPDYRYNVVLQEEAARALVTLSTVRTQLEVILPYFLHYANAEQRERWFPGLAAGTLLTAVAMTEPGTGSDLAGMRTTAVRMGSRPPLDLNGAKTFITGGMQADLVIVVARTSTDPDNRRKGLTLFVVEDGMARASPAVASWRRWAARCRTPPNCRSSTFGCPWRTCWATRVRHSATSATTCRRSV